MKIVKIEIIEGHAIVFSKTNRTLPPVKLTLKNCWGINDAMEAMDEHAEIMMNEFLLWLHPAKTQENVKQIVTEYLNSDYLK